MFFQVLKKYNLLNFDSSSDISKLFCECFSKRMEIFTK